MLFIFYYHTLNSNNLKCKSKKDITMNKIEYLNQLITKNNGIIKSSKLSEDNIPRQYLKLMLEKKLLTLQLWEN